MTTRIAHITSVHGGNDTRVFHHEVQAMRAAGFDVVLIAPRLSSAGFEAQAKGGEGIVAAPGVKLVDTAVRGRFGRFTKTYVRVVRAALAEKADVYHMHDPELLLFALVLKMLGKKVIYDVHEHLPLQILSKDWIDPRLRRIVSIVAGTIEMACTRFVDLIVAATPGVAARFIDKKRNVMVVQNFPALGELEPESRTPYAEREQLVLSVGIVSEVRGAIEMAAAVGDVPSNLDFTAEFAGLVRPPALEDLMQKLGGDRLKILGLQSRARVTELLDRARLGLCILRPLPNYLDAYPTKLFEYMSAGVPVIASDFPLWREIVTEAGCGLVADPMDTGAIAKAIAWLLEHPDEAEAMGARGAVAARAKYNWNAEAAKLVQAYESLGATRTVPPAERAARS